MIKINGSYVSGATQFKLSGAYTAVTQYIKSGGVYSSIGVNPSPLRVIAGQSYLSAGRTTKSSTNSFQRIPVLITGGDVSRIKLGFMNWYPSSSTDKNPADIGNALTLAAVGVELWDGSMVSAVTFSGSSSATMASTEYQLLSDYIDASDLGLNVFTAGTKLWLRIEANVPTVAGYFPYQGITITNENSLGARADFFNPGVTTLTNGANSTGVPVYTGTAVTTSAFPLPVVTLGEYVDSQDDHSMIIMGSSIDLRLNDNAAYNLTAESGGGFLARVCYREQLPMLNMAISGATSKAYNSGKAFFLPWFKYARFAIEGVGNNDIGYGYPSIDVQSRLTTRATEMRADGIERIGRLTLSPRTTSTDNWATFANQTIATYFGPGSPAETLRNWMINDSVAAGVYDQIIDINSTDYPGNIWYWKVNGTANYATADGIHPQPAIIPGIADEIQSQVRNLVS